MSPSPWPCHLVVCDRHARSIAPSRRGCDGQEETPAWLAHRWPTPRTSRRGLGTSLPCRRARARHRRPARQVSPAVSNREEPRPERCRWPSAACGQAKRQGALSLTGFVDRLHTSPRDLNLYAHLLGYRLPEVGVDARRFDRHEERVAGAAFAAFYPVTGCVDLGAVPAMTPPMVAGGAARAGAAIRT